MKKLKLTFVFSQLFENFTDDLFNFMKLNQKFNKKNAEKITLDKLFENYTNGEILDENNKWYCPTCKEHVQANKTMSIWSLPDILVLHFKRFEYSKVSSHTISRAKITKFIEFPLDGLDLTGLSIFFCLFLSNLLLCFLS